MPTMDYNIGGWRSTGKVRIRSSLFGFARCEELVEYRDGSKKWRPIFLDLVLKDKDKEDDKI